MPTENEIFFSYAWGDPQEDGISREKIVDDLYESLKKDGYKVIRDKYDLGYRGYISDFMTRIGTGTNIVVAISRKYMRSPYCMFELYEIARTTGFDKHVFSKKVLPLMIEFTDFSQPAVLKEYLQYWDGKYAEYKDLLKEQSDQLSAEWFQRYDKIKMIHQHFSKLADWFIDMNTLNPAMLSAENFTAVKTAILDSAKIQEPNTAGKGNSPVAEQAGITINNSGAKIGQQNINSDVDNKGANFNL